MSGSWDPWGGPPLSVNEPAVLASAAVFSSPHSGRAYPDDFVARARLDALALRASEDAFVDLLFAHVPQCGAPLIAANFPRAYLDANRGDDEIDPALVSSTLPMRARSLRVSAGLGVIPRVVAEGQPIYRGKITMAEARARIAACHAPYHTELEHRLRQAKARFGHALLVDCHSMPSERATGPARRADIVIGDCFGVACAAEVSDIATDLFRRAGFRVSRNTPFAGGYITHRYGRPRRKRHAIQIEIDRGLYLDERRIEPLAHFEEVRAALRPVISGLADLPAQMGGARLAAE